MNERKKERKAEWDIDIDRNILCVTCMLYVLSAVSLNIFYCHDSNVITCMKRTIGSEWKH